MDGEGAAVRLRPGAAHFRVVELPAYEPCGAGEHLYVEVEKENLTTEALASALARACGRRPRDVGYAGRKDRHAVARQWFSVHFGREEALARVELPRGARLEVLRASRHRNKLRPGHLRGNRFDLGLSGLDGEPAARAFRARIAERLERGVPNRFGAQRFGSGGENLRVARAWAEGAPPAGGVRFRKLVASAAQSAVFNAVLDARERLGLLRELREGDVALTPRGAPYLFPGRSPRESARASGPLPGRKMLRPADPVLAEEREWSAPAGVDWSWFERGAVFDSPGGRRALLVDFLAEPELRGEGPDARLVFALPPGGYATEVLARLGVELPASRAG